MTAQQDSATDATDAEDVQELVTCTLNGVEFGMDISAVQEIVRMPTVTPVPKAPDYVDGVANLRGNVLPVVSSRRRFGMPDKVDSDNRVIVIELNGSPTGMVVDAVREVLHIKKSEVQPPPPVVHGVDSKFLSGVVKLEEGRRLIMLLNQNEIIDIGDFKVAEPRDASGSGGQRSASLQKNSSEDAEDDTEQIVTFRLGEEEYGISIMDVQEIIRVPHITAVPNAPAGVEGITSLRNRVLPVMVLRTKLGFSELKEDSEVFCEALRNGRKAQEAWMDELGIAAQGMTHFTGALKGRDCDLGAWLEAYSTTDRLIGSWLRPLGEAYEAVHDSARTVAACIDDGDADEAQTTISKTLEPQNDAILRLFDEILKAVNERDDERCLVVNVGGMSLALRIDAVNAVLQVPKGAVEHTPEIVAGTGDAKDRIRGIAKMDDGKRLIMFLDVEKLVSEEEIKALKSTVAEGNGMGAKNTDETGSTGGASEGAERQLVTFKVADEEFAADIMLVQEIVRLEKVTKVPHAPSFVEGVVNLRGNVLPVIDLRRRFDMEAVDYDDATRVVVVDVHGQKTGIIVDAVSEVMRMPTADIQPTPAIVRDGYGEDFLEGVGRLKGGERMLLLLRVDKLLSEGEMAAMTDALTDSAPEESEVRAAA